MPEVFFRSVICLYEGAKTQVRVNSDLSEVFEVKVEMPHISVLSTFLFFTYGICHLFLGEVC